MINNNIRTPNIRLRVPGSGWVLNDYPTGPLGALLRFCVEPLGKPTVAVTLPDGRVEAFDVGASPTCNDVSPILDVDLSFTPQSGTLSTLEIVNPITARFNGTDLVLPGDTTPYNPNRYRLTTKEGFVYILNQDFGIETVTDPNGNRIIGVRVKTLQ